MNLTCLSRHPALWPRAPRRLLGFFLGCVAACVASLLMQAVLDVWMPSVVTPADPQLRELSVSLQPSIAGLQVQRDEAQRSWVALQAHWPARTRLPEVLQDIERAARRHSITLEVWRPQPVRLHAHHAEWPVQMRLHTSKGDLLAFVQEVSQLAPPVLMSEMQVQSHTSGALSLEARLSVLRSLNPQEPGGRSIKQAPAHAAPGKPHSPDPKAIKAEALNPPAVLWPVAELAHGINPFDPQRLQRWLLAHHAPLTPSWAQRELAREPQWLERFDLAELRMVGHLQQSGELLALIRARQRIHTVRVGQYLGPHAGRITAIDAQSVTLREIFQDEAGQWQQRQVMLRLERAS